LDSLDYCASAAVETGKLPAVLSWFRDGQLARVLHTVMQTVKSLMAYGPTARRREGRNEKNRGNHQAVQAR
jgi:hypothetical protein